MNISVSFPIIAYIYSPYREKFGIPRQPDLVKVRSRLKICSPFDQIDAFEGIQQFSHLWLIWHFHDNKTSSLQQTHFRPKVRPPRLGGNQKIGVFATRSMYRPATIGLSVVRFLGIEQCDDGLWLDIDGADLLNGTPILDIKPYIYYADAVLDAKSGYAHQHPQRKQVIWSAHARQQQLDFLNTHQVLSRHIEELTQVLSLDPRPAYQTDPHRIYTMWFANLDVQFTVDEHNITILQLVLKD